MHNLKNISVDFPRNKFIVVTGVSGSGKSSLTIDTLFAEGQRRYAESLSAYARQFMARMDKPDVDYIKGLCPAIAIEQKVTTRTPRSTVGSMTELYDYLRLLFARIGVTYSPVSGREVKKNDVQDVIKAMQERPHGDKILILVPFKQHTNRNITEELNILLQKGFSRLYVNRETSPDRRSSMHRRRTIRQKNKTPNFRNQVPFSLLTASCQRILTRMITTGWQIPSELLFMRARDKCCLRLTGRKN